MPRATLSLGYDTERPYGDWARGPAGTELRSSQLAYVSGLSDCLDSLGVPRTFFVLGDYLDRCVQERGAEELRGIFRVESPLVDVQQHTYSHPTLRPIPGRDDELMSAQAFAADLDRANETISGVFGRVARGLRIPRGYDEDLSSQPEILAALQHAGIDYVSSNLRGPSQGGSENFEGPLTPDRAPHNYAQAGFPQILELPSHGFQDVIFTRAISERISAHEPLTRDAIVAHYAALLRDASAAAEASRNRHVCLCLHPFAAMEYDPNFELLARIVETARELGVRLLSYSELADELRETAQTATRPE